MALTSQDLQKIQHLIKTEIHLEVDPQIEELKEKIDFLPTKDDFYNMMDKLLKEIRDNRQEQEVITYQHANLRKRVDRIETHLNLPTI